MLNRQPAIITAMLSTIYDVIWHHYASQIYSVVDTRVTVTSSDTSAVSPVITTRVGLDTGSTCLHVPVGYAGISRWRHNMLVVVCWAGFRFVWRAFSPARCHFQHSSVVSGAPLRRKLTHVYVKFVRPKCTQTLTVIIFLLITGYCFTLRRDNISKLIFMYLKQEV